MAGGGGQSSQPQITQLPRAFPDMWGGVQDALKEMFNAFGLGAPPAPTGVAPENPLMRTIAAVLGGDISGAPGSAGGVGRATLQEAATTGLPTNTDAAIAAREARRRTMAGEGSAQIREQFGTRGQRLGSGIALGTSDFLTKLDESFAQQEADIEANAREAAAGRRLTAAKDIPGFETAFTSAAFPVASAEQGLAQTPFDLARAEEIRRQGAFPFFPNIASATIGSTISQPTFGASPIPGILGGAGAAATGIANILPFLRGGGSSGASAGGKGLSNLFGLFGGGGGAAESAFELGPEILAMI